MNSSTSYLKRPSDRRFLLGLGAILFLFRNIPVHASQPPLRIQKISPPMQIPTVRVLSSDGKQVFFPKPKTEFHLINLWATWCAPCVNELPSLGRFHQRFKSEGFQVTLLSQDKGGPALARQFLAKLGVRQMPFYSDPKGYFFTYFRCRGLPTTLIADQGGFVFARIEGEVDWDSAGVADQIRRALG